MTLPFCIVEKTTKCQEDSTRRTGPVLTALLKQKIDEVYELEHLPHQD